MTQKRNLKLDLTAIALLAVVVFLTLALLSYSPADPVMQLITPLDQLFQPDTLVYPENPKVQNVCGPLGALVANVMFTGVGVGAYYLAMSLAVLDALLLMRRHIDAPVIRAIGWAASLIGLTVAAAIVTPGFSPGPVIGSGGYLGALGAGLLEMQFATVGSLILATSLIMGGLLMSTDYALIQLGHVAASATARGVSRGRSLVSVRRAGKAPDKSSDLSEEDVSIRISGMDVEGEDEELDEDDAEHGLVAEEEDDEWDADVDSDDEEETEVVIKGEDKKSQRQPKGGGGPRVRNRNAKSEREQVMERLDEASIQGDAADYELPSLDLLIGADEVCFEAQAKEVRHKAKILERTFANFGFNVKVVEIETGPVIAQYEVELEAGLRLSKITGLADDLAIALRVPSVRIVAPIPGKNTVGIEVPNQVRQLVRLRQVMEETNGKLKRMKIPLFLGKDVSGNSLTVDLAIMPHLLIAGRTGTGKSVCLNAIISSILMTRRPDEVRMLMIDPKMVELSGYGRLPHLMHPVVTDMRKAEAILAWAVDKMEERYALLARTGVRHISSYNQLGMEELVERLQPESEEEREAIPDHMPFIVIVADEIADLMMTAGKEVEQYIIRLAQKSRAVGIHLILATQKPTVDVITGLIKSNLPARIAFQVASRTDSRVVLDEMGAEKLLGNGDMLFLWPGTSTLLRGQGTYLDDEEIDSVVDVVSTGEQNFVNELVNMKVENPEDEEGPGPIRKRDELYESAIDVIVREGRGSVSLLQRTLGIGYGRAARLVDFMAEDGIVGDYNGSQAREVLISIAEWEQMQGLSSDEDAVLANEAKPEHQAEEKAQEKPGGGGKKSQRRQEEPLNEAKAKGKGKTKRSNVVLPAPHGPDDEQDPDSPAAPSPPAKQPHKPSAPRVSAPVDDAGLSRSLPPDDMDEEVDWEEVDWEESRSRVAPRAGYNVVSADDPRVVEEAEAYDDDDDDAEED
ncbi:MAG: DNA translocase FtsK 4TM domain-containing protein, partial [Pirellulaceae bacterium]